MDGAVSKDHNRMKDATLRVSIDFDYGDSRSAAVQIVQPYIKFFESVDVCDDALTAAIVQRGITTERSKLVCKQREDFAKILAALLTKQIVELMEQEDLRNGYRTDKL
mgnify:FL=1